MDSVVSAKVRQGASLLEEFRLSAWLVQFGRETHDHPSPVQRLAVGTSVTWPAAFLVSGTGETLAIVGTGDVENVRELGVYERVEGYVKDIGPLLREEISRIDPDTLGLSFSVNDDQADSLTHGMFQILTEILAETPYASRFISAEDLVVALRARKLPLELDRIRGAIATTVTLFDEIEAALQAGISEQQLADDIHRSIHQKSVEPAWDGAYCPVVNFGPESTFGHARPGSLQLQPGMLVHVDLGVKQNGYCSDLQRMWYCLQRGEREAPLEVRNAFDMLVRSLDTGFRALRPGVPAWQVDAAARDVLVGAGHPEPQFALGHQLGQSTHDGGALLGPRWPRYGNRPEMIVEEGNVFTLEFGLRTQFGTIGIEEDVVVTSAGAEYLTPPQTALRYVTR